MKYEQITILRQLISDEIGRKKVPNQEYHSMDDMQRELYSNDLKILMDLKKEIDNLDFKIK